MQIYVDTYVMKTFLRQVHKMGRKESHIPVLRIWCMEGRRGHFQFHTFSRRFVYWWHLTMQGMMAWRKLSDYRKRSQKWYSINCGHDCHVYKTNIRTFIHSFFSHCHDGVFSWSIKFSVDYFFLHRLNGNTFYVYRKYTWYLNFTLRYPGCSIE